MATKARKTPVHSITLFERLVQAGLTPEAAEREVARQIVGDNRPLVGGLEPAKGSAHTTAKRIAGPALPTSLAGDAILPQWDGNRLVITACPNMDSDQWTGSTRKDKEGNPAPAPRSDAKSLMLLYAAEKVFTPDGRKGRLTVMLTVDNPDYVEKGK